VELFGIWIGTSCTQDATVERLTAMKTEHGIQKEMTDKTEQERYQTKKPEEIERDSCCIEAKLST